MKQTFSGTFTDPYIRALKPARTAYKRSEKAPKGEGRLVVRVLPTGVKEFFYRYRAAGRDTMLSLGRYGSGKTLADIRAAYRPIRDQQVLTGDVKQHHRAEALKKEIERRKGTFHQLLDAYVQSLRDANKISAKEAGGILQRHVIKPFPEIASKRANEVEPGDIQRILAKMVRAGITRQVNATRSYLRAAFAFGGSADHDPRTVAKEGVLFGLKTNPVITIPRIAEFERTSDRTLSEDELRAYWEALEGLPLVQRATLRLNLALAQQRPTQLIRATWSEFDFEQNTLLLRDGKGRGGARDHLLPLPTFALEQLKPLRELNEHARDGDEAPSPFSSDGKRGIALETLSKAVSTVSAKLKQEKKIPDFDQRDLRRTVETMLQKLGVDREVRAHLLSHGRSQGVQGVHYERYDFLDEKRRALRKWASHLDRIIGAKEFSKVRTLRVA